MLQLQQTSNQHKENVCASKVLTRAYSVLARAWSLLGGGGDQLRGVPELRGGFLLICAGCVSKDLITAAGLDARAGASAQVGLSRSYQALHRRGLKMEACEMT
jgi:hypothetical protein